MSEIRCAEIVLAVTGIKSFDKHKPEIKKSKEEDQEIISKKPYFVMCIFHLIKHYLKRPMTLINTPRY